MGNLEAAGDEEGGRTRTRVRGRGRRKGLYLLRISVVVKRVGTSSGSVQWTRGALLEIVISTRLRPQTRCPNGSGRTERRTLRKPHLECGRRV
ncbi:hypothetical protein F2P81_024501 [Scophthalmus maximus]|uniref:Uncharacterized protein n=1 Tax=Scophthalmus maximus TaxID=52904 RepID=A0A6A4RXS8_SCOMX|nr:hypothetical protein F2P81_024501 [Scophthalmus maximus]